MAQFSDPENAVYVVTTRGSVHSVWDMRPLAECAIIQLDLPDAHVIAMPLLDSHKFDILCESVA